ncbi:MAG: hypothetical protein ACE5IZ_00935 [Dehalococcoidia bacterium]
MNARTRDVIYRGFVAGLLGTQNMGFISLRVRRAFFPDFPGRSHPKLIVHRALQAVGREGALTDQREQLIGSAIHYWYGGFWGAIYGLIHDRLPVPSVLSGWLLGMFLWNISFPGWIPALGIAEPAWKFQKAETVGTLLSHTSYGITTAMLFRALSGSPQRPEEG